VFTGGSFDRRAALPADGVVCSLPALGAGEVSPGRLQHSEQSAMAVATTAPDTTWRSVHALLICGLDAEEEARA
jgi:hypothetical protein